MSVSPAIAQLIDAVQAQDQDRYEQGLRALVNAPVPDLDLFDLIEALGDRPDPLYLAGYRDTFAFGHSVLALKLIERQQRHDLVHSVLWAAPPSEVPWRDAQKQRDFAFTVLQLGAGKVPVEWWLAHWATIEDEAEISTRAKLVAYVMGQHPELARLAWSRLTQGQPVDQVMRLRGPLVVRAGAMASVPILMEAAGMSGLPIRVQDWALWLTEAGTRRSLGSESLWRNAGRELGRVDAVAWSESFFAQATSLSETENALDTMATHAPVEVGHALLARWPERPWGQLRSRLRLDALAHRDAPGVRARRRV